MELNNKDLLDQIKSIFEDDDEEEEKNQYLLKEVKPLFRYNDKTLNRIFTKSMRIKLSSIYKMKISKGQRGAFLSAAIKGYKRDLISICLKKIQQQQQLKLTVRSADVFFRSYLGRSVNMIYLSEMFKTDYLINDDKTKTLNPEYKKHLIKISQLYKDEVLKYLNQVIDLYNTIKNSIIIKMNQ